MFLKESSANEFISLLLVKYLQKESFLLMLFDFIKELDPINLVKCVHNLSWLLTSHKRKFQQSLWTEESKHRWKQATTSQLSIQRKIIHCKHVVFYFVKDDIYKLLKLSLNYLLNCLADYNLCNVNISLKKN